MKKMLAMIFFYFVWFSLWFRYRVTIKGLENLDSKTLSKPGGVLFLPNHPTIFVDPTLVTLAVWKKFPIRPMIVEYMYYTPIIHSIMTFMNALPVPNFVTTSNSLKKKKADKVFETVIEGLKKGDNFLIYPAGKVKHQAREIIGASGVHKVIQSTPEANIVLVKTTGLWGSSFSRALTGRSPGIFPTIWHGVKMSLKNLIFFTPRRDVTIELVPAPTDFPYNASRVELNQYLEKWYNRPDGLTPTTEAEPGESLFLVSYSMWKKELPEVKTSMHLETGIDLKKVPVEIQDKIKKKLSEITHLPLDSIQPDMSLGSDLGLDSLDNAEILTYLDDDFDITGVPVSELTTVGKLMAIAAKQVAFGEQVEEEHADLSKWLKPTGEKFKATILPGDVLHEVFLNNCAKMGNTICCGDARAGIVTYAQAKLRVCLLAEYIRTLPGEYIGILLPTSVASYLTIFACQLAGKIPLMINWTVGSRHLEAVAELSKVQVVLSSWAFLDRLENTNLDGIEDLIVTLEDVRRTFTLKDKLKAFYRSKLSTDKIVKLFKVDGMSQDKSAVLLFTSGTEGMPKGVLLSHKNILSNQRAALDIVNISNQDVLLSILPPFHVFGFTVSGLLPMLSQFKIAFFPDPTDGKAVAKSVERWKATIICGAPTFLKGMFKNAEPNQLNTLRLCITGAEKAPAELFQMVKKLPRCDIMEGYGVTECSPILTINKEGETKYGVGKPITGVEVKIVDIDTHQKVLEKKQTGLIIAKGPNIFSGYLNKGLKSPFIILDGEEWYSTGDLGYFDELGNLIISGRLKRFAKIGGEMISLAALEEALQETIGQKVKHLQEEGPILAICSREEAGEKTKIFLFSRFPATIEETNRALRDSGFSNLVKISYVQELPEIPIMGTGKVNYRALESQMPKIG
ncbi:MAG: AMP-binding protein [Parachlamydiaceae bacterium]|nr:AMP-binding protein [Parachlamydiaceae bacterium]